MTFFTIRNLRIAGKDDPFLAGHIGIRRIRRAIPRSGATDIVR